MTETYPDEFLLSLPSIPVPPSVAAVAGCSCGGLDLHDQDCAIWAVPHAEALAAVDAARRRLREHTDGLNRQLHGALGRHHGKDWPMPEYAHPTRRELPGRKRCKIRHSERMPARCKHPRGHEGDHWFGWWPDPAEYPGYRGTVCNLDLPLPDVVSSLTTNAPDNFDG